jgi:cyclic pyranopterin phosphate synthase
MCLFATEGHDLRSLIRGTPAPDGSLHAPATEAELASAIGRIWQGRTDRYSQLRASLPPDATVGTGKRIEMSYIGG